MPPGCQRHGLTLMGAVFPGLVHNGAFLSEGLCLMRWPHAVPAHAGGVGWCAICVGEIAPHAVVRVLRAPALVHVCGALTLGEIDTVNSVYLHNVPRIHNACLICMA